VTRLGLGAGPLGNVAVPVAGEEAARTIGLALGPAPRLIDTAPSYGSGLSEARIGAALRGVPRDSFVISSKVGRLLHGARVETGTYDVLGQPIYRTTDRLEPAFDFSYDGVMRSYEESLERLGLDGLDIVHIHNPDAHFAPALAGAYLALHRLREAGAVGAISVGMNQWEMLSRFLDYGDFDCFLLAGRYTLLDRSAVHDLLPRCLKRGVSVIAGGVFNSGILANPVPGATYDYVPADGVTLRRALRLKLVCEEFGVPLKAAAVQFPLRHPAVASVLVGVKSAAEWHENTALFEVEIPDALWSRLEALDG